MIQYQFSHHEKKKKKSKNINKKLDRICLV